MMFENWSHFILAFLGFICIGLIIYLTGNRGKKTEGWKNEPYTCGEPFPMADVGADNFYGSIKQSLRIDEIRKLHSGRLTDYLLWMVVGVTAILIMVIFL
ncbi:MAG: hypothetical protein V1648_03875 [Candidatus Aenigmatarchaeota archaeon]